MRYSETTIASRDTAAPQRTPWATVAARCRGILDAVPAAAYTCDWLGYITYFNPAAAAVWGRAPKLRDAGDRYCGSYQLYSTDGTPMRHDECWMALALLEGRAYHGHGIVIGRRGGARTIGAAHAHPLRNRFGQMVGALNVIADMTGVGLAEAEYSLPRDAPLAGSAAVTMINVAISVLTAVSWENASFE